METGTKVAAVDFQCLGILLAVARVPTTGTDGDGNELLSGLLDADLDLALGLESVFRDADLHLVLDLVRVCLDADLDRVLGAEENDARRLNV